METFTALLAALILFLLGVRLSAFFSGGETGFYRASFLRLSIDANAGDKVAARLLWFARNPSYFVATTLVGNNVANYLATFAIGLAAVTLSPRRADWLEIVATVAVSPVVFVFGELVPKNLYYRAPLRLLRRDAPLFTVFYRLFLVLSFPLIGITRLIEKMGGPQQRPLDVVLGRNRLVQVLSYGHREGLLTNVQGRLVYGLLHTAAEPVSTEMTPLGRVRGVSEESSPREVIDFARRVGMSHVLIRRTEGRDMWYGYVRVIDLAVRRKPLSATIRPMPRLDAGTSKLQAVLALKEASAAFGAVYRGDRLVGIVGERRLVEQLFSSPQAVGVATAAGT